MKSVICAICGEDNAELLYDGGVLKRGAPLINFSNVICRACGLVYENPRMEESEIAASYGKYIENRFSLEGGEDVGKYLRHIEGKNKKNANIDFLKQFLKSEHEVLEIGSGFGIMLRGLKESIGCRLEGIEPATSAKYAEKGGGVPVFHGTFDEYFEKYGNEKKFDAVLMHHVFEHFPEPLEVLKKLKKILKPGGLLYIEVPNILNFERRVKYFFDFWHYYNYSPGTLEKILKKGGFKIVKRNAAKPSRIQIVAAERGSVWPEEKISEEDSYSAIAAYIAKRKISDPFLAAAFFVRRALRKIWKI